METSIIKQIKELEQNVGILSKKYLDERDMYINSIKNVLLSLEEKYVVFSDGEFSFKVAKIKDIKLHISINPIYKIEFIFVGNLLEFYMYSDTKFEVNSYEKVYRKNDVGLDDFLNKITQISEEEFNAYYLIFQSGMKNLFNKYPVKKEN